MISLSLNGVKNTIASFNVFNFSFNRDLQKTLVSDENQEMENDKQFEKKKLIDYKTTLTGSSIDLIENFNDNLIIYLFIEKHKDGSAWNLVAPIILEQSTERITQFGLGYFALEGCGGGLANTDSIFYYIKKHIQKGFKVSIQPKVVDNEILKDFEYVDSGIKLNDLIDNSLNLINYQKEEFEWIYKKYQGLIQKYNLENI